MNPANSSMDVGDTMGARATYVVHVCSLVVVDATTPSGSRQPDDINLLS